MRKCWEEWRIVLSERDPAEKAFRFTKQLINSIKLHNDLQGSEHLTKKKMHTNEWGLSKVSELPTHSKGPSIFFSQFCIASHNCLDASVSEDARVRTPSGF